MASTSDHPDVFHGFLKMLWPCHCWGDKPSEDDEIKTRCLESAFEEPRGANGDVEADSHRLIPLQGQQVFEQEAQQELRSLELPASSSESHQGSRVAHQTPQTSLAVGFLGQSERVKWMLAAMVCLIVALVANQVHLPGSDGVSGGISSLLLLLLLKGTSSPSGQ